MSKRLTTSDLELAEDIEIVEDEEFWNIYKLRDGTTLKVKLIVRGIKRLQKHGADGNPIYVVNSANVIRAIGIPKNLKAKPKPSKFKPI